MNWHREVASSLRERELESCNKDYIELERATNRLQEDSAITVRMGDNMNLEHRALLNVSGVLIGSFRPGIKTLCQHFHSQELLVDDIHQISLNNPDDPTLSERVVHALLERVKNDRKAFVIIVRVLYLVTSMEYLAKKLEEKLAEVQEEHLKNVAKAQQEQARLKEFQQTIQNSTNQAQKHEQVMVQAPRYGRPTDLNMSTFRDALPLENASFHTGPAYSQSTPFVKTGGSGFHSVGSNPNKSMVTATADKLYNG